MNNPNEAVLLTEDGHPIGEVVLSDNASVPPVVPNEDVVASNRDELLRAEAQELTGDPDADRAVAEIFPGYGDPDKRKKAMTAFVVDRKTVEETAALVEVPPRTVSMWIHNGHWDSIAKKELAVQQSQSILELARLRADKRLEIAKSQLAQAQMIRDTAASNIEEGTGSLKSNTEAWAAAAKIEHTLTGVSEAGTIADIDGKSAEEKKDGGKQPLVMIFNGGLPPIRKANQ